VRLIGSSSGSPHSGQYRALSGVSAPQCGQASRMGDALIRFFCPGIERF